MPRLKNIPTQTFDPQAIRILDSALDGAWEGLTSAGQYTGDAQAVRTQLARDIMCMAKKGERDRQRLIQGALAGFRRTSTSARLPDRFPVGSAYVVEARGSVKGMTLMHRYVQFPDGRQVELAARLVPTCAKPVATAVKA